MADRKKRELSERENVVGYIGRLELAKGVINLVRAMPSVVDNNPGVRFLVVGSGTLGKSSSMPVALFTGNSPTKQRCRGIEKY